MFEWSVRLILGKSGDPLVDSGCRKSNAGFTNASKVGGPDGSNNSMEFLNPACSRLIVEEIADRSLKWIWPIMSIGDCCDVTVDVVLLDFREWNGLNVEGPGSASSFRSFCSKNSTFAWSIRVRLFRCWSSNWHSSSRWALTHCVQKGRCPSHFYETINGSSRSLNERSKLTILRFLQVSN